MTKIQELAFSFLVEKGQNFKNPKAIKLLTDFAERAIQEQRTEESPGISLLNKWTYKYNFSFQIYNGSYNIYVSKNDVDLFSTGGHSSFEEGIPIIVEWLERVNKKK